MWYYLALFLSKDELSYAYAVILSAAVLSQARSCSHYMFGFTKTCRAAVHVNVISSSKRSSLQVIGGPIAAALLLMEGVGGLHGWQWLFILEGALTLVYGGILAVIFLPVCIATEKACSRGPGEHVLPHAGRPGGLTEHSGVSDSRGAAVGGRTAEGIAGGAGDRVCAQQQRLGCGKAALPLCYPCMPVFRCIWAPSRALSAACMVLGGAAPLLSLRMWWLCVAWMLMGAAVTNLLVWTPLILEAALAGSFGGQATPAQHQALSLREQVCRCRASLCMSAMTCFFYAEHATWAQHPSAHLQSRACCSD